jgi:uncharacterized protein YjbI with pentapeptide repeats
VANPEHVEVLREGVEALAFWRAQNPETPLDLTCADLSGWKLCGALLGEADFREAVLVEADLSEADLRAADFAGADFRAANLTQLTGHAVQAQGADFRRAVLQGADLRAGNFQGADFRAANLGEVDLRVASLTAADFRRADLHKADLRRADLTEADFQDAHLRDAHFGESQLINVNFARAGLDGVDFDKAIVSGTLWNDVDLSEARNLETMIHNGPSSVGVDTIYQSRGRIPASFLRGSGINESFIANASSLAAKALQFHRVLIVHAEEDRPQVERLAQSLQKRGVRCWLESVTDEAASLMELHRHRRGQKLLFCVSRNWLSRQTATHSLETVRMLESKSSAETGLAVRNWYSVDFDGVLKSGMNGEVVQFHQERLVAEFHRGFSENGQFDQQLENVLSVLTAYTGAGDQATLADQALTQLRQLMGHAERLQEGYQKLRHNDGAKNQWFDYCGEQRRSYHIRQLVRGRCMEWETAPVVFERGQDLCFFCFAGAMGAQNKPPGLGFYLTVNGEATVPFNLARDERAWHSADHTVTLLYSPHWLSRDDSSGFFYVAVLKDRLTPGEPCRLGVQVRGHDSPRWFALFPEQNAVECQTAFRG